MPVNFCKFLGCRPPRSLYQSDHVHFMAHHVPKFNDLRQVVHTHVPLLPSSIIWYRLHRWDVTRHTARYTGPVSVVSQCKNWCHVWGAVLEAYRKLKSKPKTSAKLKEALQVIWGKLLQRPIDKRVKDFTIRQLEAGVVAWSWRWTLQTFAVTMEFWHLIIIYQFCFNDVIKLVLYSWNIFECWKISRRSC